MCIGLLSTAHPSYSLILLSNRDEYLHRPTLRADWWLEPDLHVLGGRDLQRSIQGTWLGITRQGRFALLTNFREENQIIQPDVRSRGEIAKAFLTLPAHSPVSPEEWVNDVLSGGVTGVGGFSLLFGELRRTPRDRAVGIFSNRSANVSDVHWFEGNLGGHTIGLSNALFGNRNWPKVARGEELLHNLIAHDQHAGNEQQDVFIESCFSVLSEDSLPRPDPKQNSHINSRDLRKSIFISPIGRFIDAENMPADELASGQPGRNVNEAGSAYGTQKQTVILVDFNGHVVFVERTLFNQNIQPLDRKNQDRRFDFDIEGWYQQH